MSAGGTEVEGMVLLSRQKTRRMCAMLLTVGVLLAACGGEPPLPSCLRLCQAEHGRVAEYSSLSGWCRCEYPTNAATACETCAVYLSDPEFSGGTPTPTCAVENIGAREDCPGWVVGPLEPCCGEVCDACTPTPEPLEQSACLVGAEVRPCSTSTPDPNCGEYFCYTLNAGQL